MDRKHVCILPKDVAVDASSPSTRFLRLPHPRTHQPALFLPYTRDAGLETARPGLLEVQKVRLDADKQRCWFVGQEVVSDGSISIFSPVDPVFLVMAYLSAIQPHYLSYADLWDAIAQHRFESPSNGDEKPAEDDQESPFAEDLLRLGQMDCVKERLVKVCDTQEHDGTTLYRLSQPAILSLLKSKVDALVDASEGVFGALESTSPGEEKAEKVEASQENDENSPAPASTKRKFSMVTRGLGKEGAGNGHGLSEQIQTESRQRYAIGIIANYLPPALAHTLLSSHSFSTLTAYLSSSSTSTVLGTTYLPGRASAKLEAAELALGLGLGGGAAAKKRKAEASKGSRGVEALKKVNTKGMTSLRDMFAKQSAKPTVAEKKEASAKKKAKKA